MLYCVQTRNDHLNLLGQTAVLSGTNYVSGSGFCFADQQLQKGTPFISCTASGFTGEVDTYDMRWFINDGSVALIESEVRDMYPIIAERTSAGESRLNITNINSLGVSSVACRISADDKNGNQLGPAVRSTSENISVVNSRQTAQYFIIYIYIFMYIYIVHISWIYHI